MNEPMTTDEQKGKNKYPYRMVRVVCNGTIKGCDHCRTIDFFEGYCKLCMRPLWKKIGDPCRFVVGYMDRTPVPGGDQPLDPQGKVNFKCQICRTITTL